MTLIINTRNKHQDVEAEELVQAQCYLSMTTACPYSSLTYYKTTHHYHINKHDIKVRYLVLVNGYLPTSLICMVLCTEPI
jgi:hypothetical protein